MELTLRMYGIPATILSANSVAAWIFWISVTIVFYAYAGYPLWLLVLRRWRFLPVRWDAITPCVSIIIAVRNEAERLPAKLENLARLQYPSERLQIIVVSDGSTDGTNQILALHPEIRSILLPHPEGKASALNHAVLAAKGEILVFMDVRQEVDEQALQYLAGNFADLSVGCVSGELVLRENQNSKAGCEVGLYWRIEKQIRKLESETGSVVGVTGALYAIRRDLMVHLPAGTLCDDLYVPMYVIRQKKRVVFESRALAYDHIFSGWRHEFRRKTRTLTGNYQLLQLAPWLLTRTNPARFHLLSHKFTRLFVPFALAFALAGSLCAGAFFYHAAFIAQLGFYLLALLPLVCREVRPPRLASLSFTFVMLNSAAVAGLVNFLGGRRNVWSVSPADSTVLRKGEA